MLDIKAWIMELKLKKDAVILAHYYVDDDIQEIADYVGDSYYLSELATKVPQKVVCFAGVNFMGESAKILNPDKVVLLPDTNADCPMAHMVEIDTIEKMREKYEDLAVVCYINSTAELKKHSDICVTSSNAIKIVRKLPNKNIFFIPDENLGSYVAEQVPEKNIILNKGFCHVHKGISKENIISSKKAKPNALVLVHPECTKDVLEQADYIGSTKEIIEFASSSSASEFLIGTELGVLYELKKRNPDKKFYSVGSNQYCPNMKKISLEKIADCLENMTNQVLVSEEDRIKANIPLKKMLEMAK